MSKIVLFDAVGTILKTSPGVIEVYHRHGLRHGSSLSFAEVKSRFKAERRRLFDLDASAKNQAVGRLVSSDEIERDLWFELIASVFDDVALPEPLFEALWRFFACPDNWRLYDDTDATFRSLKSAGYRIGIASNFDSRLNEIVRAFPQLRSADFVFCSAVVGFRKPDPAFYRTVESEIQKQLGCEIQQPLWMTGDCIENDFWGPRRHGWKACWLNRTGSDAGQTSPEVDSIESLSALAERITGI